MRSRRAVLVMVKRLLAILASFLVTAEAAASSTYYPPSGRLQFASGFSRCRHEAQPFPGYEMRCVPPPLEAAAADADRARRHLVRAEGFVTNLENARAAAEIEAALALAPDLAETWHLSGRFKLTEGDDKGARADIDRALSIEQSDANVWATSSLVRQDASDALADLDRALALAPTHVAAMLSRARLHRSRGRHDLAKRDMEILVQLAPTNYEVETYRIRNAIAADQVDVAVRLMDERVTRDPTIIVFVLERGTFLQAIGRHEGAIRDFTTIVGNGEPVPRHVISTAMEARLHFLRAVSLNALGKVEEARADIVAALRRADKRGILGIQTYLRSKGYDDFAVTGAVSPDFESAAVSCMLNAACGRGITARL